MHFQDGIETALAEIERCAKTGQYVQINVAPRANEPLGRSRYWSLFALAQELDLPVGIHSGGGWEFDMRNGQSYFDPARVKVRTYPVVIEDGETLAKGPFVAETFPVYVEDSYVVVEINRWRPAAATPIQN